MTRPACPSCGSPVNAAGETRCWRHRPQERPKAARKARRRVRHRDPVPPDVYADVRARDGGCVGPRAGFPGSCSGPIELDHIRTRGLGRRGPSTRANLVSLCRSHHRWKTAHARAARRMLDALMVLPRALGGLGQVLIDRGRIVDNPPIRWGRGAAIVTDPRHGGLS